MLPSRVRPPRQQTESAKPAPLAVKTINAPSGGIITNSTLATAASAQLLENFWPTPRGIEPRGGCATVASVPAGVVSLFEHRGSDSYFAATASAIYPFNDATTGGGALTAAISGLTNGKWSTYEAQNSGGNFLLCVNGIDHLRRFDGTTWLTITGTGTGAITGVDTDTLSFVWGHRNRIFFCQNDSSSAWYLATNAVGGAATELPLAGVFRKGGSLLMGGTWSSDSGSGMDDRCFFITDQGELALYAGSNPADVNNWSLVGVYDVGLPLGRKSMIYIGGDVLFATHRGVVPLSAVVTKDPTEMAAATVTAAIQGDWNDRVERAVGDWRLGRWSTIGMIFALPVSASGESPTILAANAENGAWTQFTGWDAVEMSQLGDRLYFGTTAGKVVRAWVGGQDNGMPYLARAMLAPDHLSDAANTKSASVMQAVWKVRGSITYTMGLAINYNRTWGVPPDAASVPPGVDDVSLWDIALWDLAPWSSSEDSYSIVSGWRSVTGVGFAFAPTVQLMCNSPARVICQLQRIDVGFQAGGFVT
ncbi:hypothetical protein [Paracoccus sp. PAR01]|uniref:hypothetical protein n=1 Tax=Paracoccus sp. PAR01 TaxID=2769282 RepID=UPI00177A8F79|nr:hypothetical protein [Paracoccus sp. PAR01]MBD9528976.1 hypothetical protein [Paracoccus sp. PAR01]